MALSQFFEPLQASAFATALSGSTWMFPALETLHVFALAIVAGSILVVDLRLLGIASTSQKVTAVSEELLPWTWIAFAAAVVTGTLLFVSRAADYVAVPYFNAKFVLMALAGLNMGLFHVYTYRSIERWNLGPTPMGAKVAGALSLIFWALIIVCGRRVGFSI
jgi:hypothetical protein